VFARRFIAALLLPVLGLTLSGCFDPFAPRVGGRGISVPAPTPNSPTGLLRLFEWAYNNRDYSQYRTVFTDDYRFAFAAQDTAGNRYRDQPYTRADELASAQKLFDAATNISLQLDKNFAIFNDPRPGKYDPLRRKNIRTQVLLNITTIDGGQTNVQGKANFFLVRGDSAAIPADLGFRPDSNRWYIERWEDETFATSLQSAALSRMDAGGRIVLPAATHPVTRPGARRADGTVLDQIITWGELKLQYQ
jgi:hypothetical protein